MYTIITNNQNERPNGTWSRGWLFVLIAVAILLLTACSQEDPTPTIAPAPTQEEEEIVEPTVAVEESGRETATADALTAVARAQEESGRETATAEALEVTAIALEESSRGTATAESLEATAIALEESSRGTATAEAVEASARANQTATAEALLPGSTRIRPADEVVMVYVPAGSFLMGSDPAADPDAYDDEQPQHEVTLDGFWIDQTEVTNEKYNHCVAAGECDQSGIANDDRFNTDDQPVVEVSWSDAKTYCEWAGGQLPTEAQWEYAARGRDGHIYPWGNEFDGELLNFCDRSCSFDHKDENYDDGFEFIAPVGTYRDGASWVAAYDMAGNVWEWTADWYDEDYYDASPTLNPTGPTTGEFKVLRGGSWLFETQNARSAIRFFFIPTFRDSSLGFRCAAPGP